MVMAFLYDSLFNVIVDGRVVHSSGHPSIDFVVKAVFFMNFDVVESGNVVTADTYKLALHSQALQLVFHEARDRNQMLGTDIVPVLRGK